MSDPTTLKIEQGDPEQIINEQDLQMNVPFIVEVKSNPVRFAHSKQAAERGATLSSGQTHTLSNFRGEGIWLSAWSGDAEVRVRPAGANVESAPPKGVTVEGDVNIASQIDVTDDQARQIGKARVMDSGGTLVDPASETTLAAILTELEEQTALLQQIETNTSA